MGPLKSAGSVPVMFAPITAPVASLHREYETIEGACVPVMSCATPAASMIAAL